METVSAEQKVYSAVNNLETYGEIIALRKVRRDEYVVLRKGNEVTPYVTHRMYVRDSSGTVEFESGNYFFPGQYEEALNDFATR